MKRLKKQAAYIVKIRVQRFCAPHHCENVMHNVALLVCNILQLDEALNLVCR